MKVVWTEQAFTRLAEIREYIAVDNPVSADELVERLIARTEALSAFPKLGRRVAEVPSVELRELVEENYRVVYRLSGECIQVLTVFEGHRSFPEEDVVDSAG